MLQCGIQGGVVPASFATDLLGPMRESLAAEGGSLVVEKAPAALKVNVDAWGPIAPEQLTIMSRLKREFDPDGILNPGRFVGGL